MIVFKDREDAGRRLARRLEGIVPGNGTMRRKGIVLGIPRGGVAVGSPVARRFSCPLVPVSLRKLPVPFNDQMGFGAVALGRHVTLNEQMIDAGYVRREDVGPIVDEVYAEVLRRDRLYRGGGPFPGLAGRFVIIVDDGLATGYTMLAAVRLAFQKGAEKPVVAVPVAHRDAFELVKKEAGSVTALHVDAGVSFAVASFYEDFPDLTDAAVIGLLEENRAGAAQGPTAKR